MSNGSSKGKGGMPESFPFQKREKMAGSQKLSLKIMKALAHEQEDRRATQKGAKGSLLSGETTKHGTGRKKQGGKSGKKVLSRECHSSRGGISTGRGGKTERFKETGANATEVTRGN